MSTGLQLASNLDEFIPRRRQAVFLNGVDRNVPVIDELYGVSEGSSKMYEMEAALSGSISVDRALTRAHVQFVRDSFDVGSQSRADIRYEVARIQTFEAQKRKLWRILNRFCQHSDKDTLTFLCFYAHGSSDRLKLSSGFLQYTSLLDKLDAIAGKKY